MPLLTSELTEPPRRPSGVEQKTSEIPYDEGPDSSTHLCSPFERTLGTRAVGTERDQQTSMEFVTMLYVVDPRPLSRPQSRSLRAQTGALLGRLAGTVSPFYEKVKQKGVYEGHGRRVLLQSNKRVTRR